MPGSGTGAAGGHAWKRHGRFDAAWFQPGSVIDGDKYMPSINFLNADGSTSAVQAEVGETVMQVAVMNGVVGIEAECGGAAACATCHVYVDEAWFDRLKPMGDDENDMLDCATAEWRPNSRLSCQISLTDELDGLSVRLPEKQS